MIKIGFIDYYLGNWHAENYPAWIQKASEQLGIDCTIACAWAEEDVSPVNGKTTEEWCKQFGVEACATLEEVCQKCDRLVILAPSTPEKHLAYAKRVLPFGKPTYIDKTFAPDAAEAEQIFALGKQYNAPFFSTSALRYATELKELANAKEYMITGGGSNFNEYCIHMIEMAAILLQEDAVKVKVECINRQSVVRALCASGKQATFVFAPPLPYIIVAQNEDGGYKKQNITSDFFVGLICDILRFFDTGVLPVTEEETMRVMKMRTQILNAFAHDGEWV